jgi:hypothetical protein
MILSWMMLVCWLAKLAASQCQGHTQNMYTACVFFRGFINSHLPHVYWCMMKSRELFLGQLINVCWSMLLFWHGSVVLLRLSWKLVSVNGQGEVYKLYVISFGTMVTIKSRHLTWSHADYKSFSIQSCWTRVRYIPRPQEIDKKT